MCFQKVFDWGLSVLQWFNLKASEFNDNSLPYHDIDGNYHDHYPGEICPTCNPEELENEFSQLLGI